MSRNFTKCVVCAEEASGQHSIPIDMNGDVVPVDYKGEWAGSPVCEACFELHKAAGDHCNAVLYAYVKASENLRAAAADLRVKLEKIESIVRDAL